jgi:NDP-sugar pyrophosphorylase family protein
MEKTGSVDQAIILSGGLGTRLRPITLRIPKCMVPIRGRPFVDLQLELLEKNGMRDAVLSLGYKSEQVVEHLGSKKQGVAVRYSIEREPLGTGGALLQSRKMLKENFIVLYGDSYLPLDFRPAIKAFQKSGAMMLMTVYRNSNRFIQSNVAIEGGLVVKYVKGSSDPSLDCIDYGLMILSKKCLDYITEEPPVDMGVLFQKLIKMKQVAPLEVKAPFFDVGTFEGLKRFRSYAYRKRL